MENRKIKEKRVYSFKFKPNKFEWELRYKRSGYSSEPYNMITMEGAAWDKEGNFSEVKLLSPEWIGKNCSDFDPTKEYIVTIKEV